MGQTIVGQVIEALKAVDIRADEAYPGGRIPALTGSVAAVRLGKVDRSVRTTSVEVIIMSPAAAGGGVCETTALRAVDALQDMGATCVKDVCRFDEMADVFYIEIDVRFFGTAMEGDWSGGPGFSILIGEQAMNQVVRFSAQRSTDENTAAISDAKWKFTMEELLPPGTSEPADPTEPFALTVSRSGGEEIFAGCTWISVKREDTIKGVSQIRVGLAQSRNVMGVL